MRIFLILILLLPILAFSQNGKVVGKVRDQKGNPLLGAAIIYRSDITIGAISDEKGNYVLEIPAGKSRLICRYTGMLTDTIAVTVIENQTVQLDIVLSEFVTELDFVEVKVGKFDKAIEDLTFSMEVIKPQLIENKNTRSIETALDQTPGLNILDGEPQIRGGSGFTFGVGSKVAVLVDDMPMLSGDAGRPEWGFVPVENIHQIEVIKGASSVLSGSSALSGSIHIRTAYPKLKPLTKVSVYSGMYSSPADRSAKWWTGTPLISGANFLHTRIHKNVDIVVGGNMNYDHGYIGAPITDPFIEDTISNFTDKQMSSKRARINFSLRRRSQKLKGLSYGLNGNIMLAQTNMAFAWLNDSSGLYRAYPGAVFLQDQFIAHLDPYFQFMSQTGGKHSLRTRILRTDNQMTANQTNQATVLYGDYQFQRTYKQLKELEFIGGITGTHSHSYANLYAGSGSPFNSLLNISGYSQFEKKIQQTINFSIGGRLEYYALNDSIRALKPILRAGASMKIYQETYLRASYGQGYRFPTITERFIKTGVGNFGVYPNPDLKPESSWNSEIGIKQGLKFGKIFGYLDLAGFWQEYENTIEYMFGFWDLSSPVAAGFKFLNTGKSRVLGIDASFNGQAKLSKELQITFITGYTYILPTTLNPDLIYAYDQHPVSPKPYSYNSTSLDPSKGILKYRFLHNIKGDFELEYKKNWAFGLSLKYFSKMLNLDAVIADFEESTAVIATMQNIRYMDYFNANRHGNWIFDARFSYQINDKHKIAIIGSNILNNSYSLRPLKIEAPRTLMLQYNYKLDKN
jgi:outer membrane receptor protein involved in Fe transport